MTNVEMIITSCVLDCSDKNCLILTEINLVDLIVSAVIVLRQCCRSAVEVSMECYRSVVVSQQESRNETITTLNESHKLSAAQFLLSDRYSCPVLVSSWHSLLPLTFQ